MKRLDLIIDALDYINKFTNLDVVEALAAARELRNMKPFSWSEDIPLYALDEVKE